MNFNKQFSTNYDEKYNWIPIPKCLLDRYPKAFYLIMNIFTSLFIILVLSQFRQLINNSLNKFFPEKNLISSSLLVISIILTILLILVLHEFSHMLFVPKSLLSNKIYIYLKTNFKKSGPTAYIYYNGEISKNNLILMKLAPFIILTVIPFSSMLIIEKWNVFIVLISLINITGSTHDIISSVELLFKLPKRAVLYGNQFRIKEL